MRSFARALPRRLVDLALLAAVASLLGLAAGEPAAGAAGLATYVIDGGSMEPAIPLGALVAVRPADPATIRPGDVLTARTDTGIVFTHRVTALAPDGDAVAFRTKGDANAAADPQPVPARAVLGTVAGVVPFAGYLRALLATPSGMACVGSALAALVLLHWLLADLEPRRGRRRIVSRAELDRLVREGARVVPASAVAATAGVGVAGPAASRAGTGAGLTLGALAVLSLLALGTTRHGSASAYFVTEATTTASVSAARIFPGDRTTTGFVIHDRSGGGLVDRTSAFALAGDGRTAATKAAPAAFADARYVELAMGAPLPEALDLAGAAFHLSFASTGSGTACVIVQVRSIADGTLRATYGSAGSPAACVTGTTLGSATVSLPAVTTTGLANDLAIRLLVRESGGAGLVIDQATVTATEYAGVTTYPVRLTDAADGTPESAPWELQGP